MSYSNPKWYGIGDTYSFSRSFEKTFNTQFKSAYDYYDAKSKELEEYNNNLEVEAEKQRQELLKGKEVTPKVLAKVESAVQDFLKQGRQITKDTDIFGAPDLVKKSKAEIDKASASFTGRIGVANEFLEKALTGKLIPKRDLDRGSATYLKYNKILNAIKEDPNSFDFKYTGDNEYDFSVKYKNEDGSVKSVSADELKAMMELNDPETRKLIDKNFKETSVQMYGLTKTAFSERIARGEYKKDPRTGSIYVPEEDVDVIVGEQVGKMKKETINDYFNNEIEYDDTKRLDILSKSDIGLELKDIADKGTNDQKEALSTLLDIPEGDVASREAAFNKLGITDKAKKQEYIEALNQYRKDIVADRFKEELKSQGLQTKYFTGKTITSPRSSGGSSRSRGGKGSKEPYVDERAGQAARDAMSVANSGAFNSTATGNPKAFTPGRIRVNDKFKDVSGVSIDANGVMSVKYAYGSPYKVEVKNEKTGKKETKTRQKQKTKTYNTKDPKEMSDFYRDVAEKPTTEGFEQEMISRYVSVDGLKDLNQPGMVKWAKWIQKTAPNYYDKGEFQKLLMNHLADPTTYNNKNARVNWFDFISENKDMIDTLYRQNLKSIRNTGVQAGSLGGIKLK